MRFINRVLLLVAGLVLIGVLQQQGASNAFAATTYYIDSLYGNDANSGTTEAQPWQTLAPVNSRMASACSPCAQPGDTFHFKAGSVLTGTTLTLERSGTAASRIRFDKYGTGNDPDFLLSTYDPGPDPRPCVEVFADYITLANMRIRSCFAHWGGPIFDGVKVRGDYFLLDQVTVQNNMAGINITGLASNGRITNSVIFGNTYGDGSGSSGDGILLHGSNNEIDHNTIQQNHWTDGSGCLHGASIEVYGDNGEHADNNNIHHNLSYNNKTFTEIGVLVDRIQVPPTPNDPSDDVRKGTADNNVYTFNIVRGDMAPTNCGSATRCQDGWKGLVGFVTRGDNEDPTIINGLEVEYGPIFGTVINNNTIYFTGECSQGIVCGGDCNSSIITIKNTTSTAVWKGAYIGNKTGITWPSANIDYDGFRKTGTGQGGQHCQFQSPTCPALTHGLSPYSVDPGFLNPSTWDLRPRCASEGTISPLIDVGASLGYSTDYAGTSIPQDGNGVGGAQPDIGAYERQCFPPP